MQERKPNVVMSTPSTIHLTPFLARNGARIESGGHPQTPSKGLRPSGLSFISYREPAKSQCLPSVPPLGGKGQLRQMTYAPINAMADPAIKGTHKLSSRDRVSISEMPATRAPAAMWPTPEVNNTGNVHTAGHSQSHQDHLGSTQLQSAEHSSAWEPYAYHGSHVPGEQYEDP